MTLATLGALGLAAAGVVALLGARAAGGDRQSALALLRELWTAAALLYLTGDRGWPSIGAAALIVLARAVRLRPAHPPAWRAEAR